MKALRVREDMAEAAQVPPIAFQDIVPSCVEARENDPRKGVTRQELFICVPERNIVRGLHCNSSLGSCPEWREDREGVRTVFAPKGLQDSARGFNPGNRPPTATRPKGAQDRA